jgi:hypothetical protein
LRYLKEYLAGATRKPKLVLFEIAGGYDNAPLYQVHQMRFSDRMIAMMDGSSASWALRYLWGAYKLSVPERFMLGGEILAQLALHVSHIGYLWNPSRNADLQIAALRLPHTPPSRLPSHPQFSCRDPAGRSRTVRRPLGISGSGFGGDERGGVVDARARVRSRWRHRG